MIPDVQFDIAHAKILILKIWVDAMVYRILDTCYCPKCGPRLKSLAEVVARGEGFICTACNSVTQSEEMEIPF